MRTITNNEIKLLNFIKKNSFCKNKQIMMELYNDEEVCYRPLDRNLQMLRKKGKIKYKNGWVAEK